MEISKELSEKLFNAVQKCHDIIGIYGNPEGSMSSATAISGMIEILDDQLLVKAMKEHKKIDVEIQAESTGTILSEEITDVEFEETAPEVATPEVADANPRVREWPNSSNVARTEYDNKERVLIVTFKGTGKRYAYHDFLDKDWGKIVKLHPDGSIGKHINSEVKGVHASTPLDAPTKPAPSQTGVSASDL